MSGGARNLCLGRGGDRGPRGRHRRHAQTSEESAAGLFGNGEPTRATRQGDLRLSGCTPGLQVETSCSVDRASSSESVGSLPEVAGFQSRPAESDPDLDRPATEKLPPWASGARSPGVSLRFDLGILRTLWAIPRFPGSEGGTFATATDPRLLESIPGARDPGTADATMGARRAGRRNRDCDNAAARARVVAA